jgi:serine/threonine-protein kinase
VLFEMLTGDVPFKGDNQVAVAMKHVREQLPDVQMRRPEVSSALAAVVDRATAKDLEHRYADDRELIADLEDALAIETARSGQATGEATAVLRTLSPQARRRLPARVAHPLRWLLLLGAIAAAAVAAVVLLAGQTEHGTGQPPGVTAPPGLQPVSLMQDGVHDYDPPPGDGHEHSGSVRAVLDRDPNTTWSTESYQGGVFASGKKGVGIYIDAQPSAAGRVLEIRTPKPGWQGQIYVAKSGPPKSIDGWQRVADFTMTAKRQRIDLDTARQRFRYYLIWITKLPPGDTKAQISEVLLFQ